MAVGHRSRMRKRFLDEDIDSFPEYSVLEMMLHAVKPIADTSELARSLLREFGTLAQVIDAPYEELIKVRGVGDAVAAHLKLIPKFYMRYLQSKNEHIKIIKHTEQAGEYLFPLFIGRQVEVLIVLCLDAKGKILGHTIISEGIVDTVNVNVRKIVEIAVLRSATRLVIAHNHLSGIALPSSADITVTRALGAALKNMNISLDDHIIFAEDDYVSMAQSGMMNL